MSRGLQLLLVAVAPVAVFLAMIGADRLLGAPGRGNYALRIELPPAGGQIGLPPVEGPLDASRPLVVIDPGHGGHDPGAGAGATKEKDLTLALALELRRRLLSSGGIRVALTRSDDRYLMLEERSGIARQLKADLFISLHADSADRPEASGATVYTLSDKGSDEIATRLAARENQSDIINGVRLAATSDAVGAILVDLSQRAAAARSDEFARLILREAGARVPFRARAIQQAAFAVLKSPDLPSVLFEVGYISNDTDASRLASGTGQTAFAEATVQAIRVFFARHATGG